MAVTTLLVCELTRQRLGNDGLAELAACLWPVDCQSCGRLLGDEPPAVVVDDLSAVAVASLHHQRCRLPEWNDSMVVLTGPGQYTTFVARMVLLPITRDDGTKETCPLLLVNPSLECVRLQRTAGGWRFGHSQWLAQAGLVRPGAGLVVGAPADGLVARATDSSVAVVLQVPPFTVYEAPADERLLNRARALGGVLVVMTPALNPGDFTFDDLLDALADPRTVAGWAGLHGTRRVPRRRFRLRPQVCVLHWNYDLLSVGVLVRQAPRKLTADRAREWAERALGPGQGEPVAWRPVREDCPDEGWHGCAAFSGREYALRRHADGWKLVLICGLAPGTRAETDNEAKAWAADIFENPGWDLAAYLAARAVHARLGHLVRNPLMDQVTSFEAVYRSERSKLIRYLMSIGVSQHQADDAVQATFARAYDRWDAIRHPRAWLYKVALRESYRVQAGHCRREIPAGDALPDPPAAADTGDLVVLNEEEERVRAALAALPARQRQVMALTIAGFTPAEIAGELGCDPAAVRQNQVRARDNLARQLGLTRRNHR